jgi:DNA-3-methyladenine glycosylase II
MLTEDFEAGIAKLHALTAGGSVALMCAEAVPWRCHRSLVADAVTARGGSVEHITSARHSTLHRMAPFADVEGIRVTYPGEDTTDGRLATRGPFHLEATVRVLQRRPTNVIDVWDHDRYLRVLATVDGLVLVEVVDRGTIEDPDVRFNVLRGDLSSASRQALRRTLRQMLGLDVNPAPLQQLAEAEPRLSRTVRALRGMRPPRFAGLFEAFANVVPFQQVSIDSGVAIVGRLVKRFGTSLEHGGRRFHAFPTAHVVAEARLSALRECGMSLRKGETLRRVACAIESGELTKEKLGRMASMEAIRFLAELRGIGPWSAGLVLLRGLGRLDVFPPGDVGVARGLSKLTRIPWGSSFERVAQCAGDHRGYLYFCSLGGVLLARGLIHAAPPARLPERLRRVTTGRKNGGGEFR